MANIIIVGANQGIGYYIAERLLARGHSVAILDTSLDQAKALQASYPQRLLPVCADARDASSIQSGVAQTVTAFGSIDAAIHNACLCTFASEPDTGYDVYQDVLDVNFFGALRLAKAVLPYMRKAGKGRIIFTSSGVGVTGFVNISPYASSKGAIEALAKCLEIENQPYGISFHLFHPPLTNTASAAGLPIPKEFKADARTVGYGLADHIWSQKFVICHSALQSLQIWFSYRHPLWIGQPVAFVRGDDIKRRRNGEDKLHPVEPVHLHVFHRCRQGAVCLFHGDRLFVFNGCYAIVPIS